MVAAPAVITTLTVARKCAAKIAGGEAGHVVGKTELFHRALKRVHGLAQFREQIGVRADHHVIRVVIAVISLAGVQIVAADLAEKNLAFHAETAVRRRRCCQQRSSARPFPIADSRWK